MSKTYLQETGHHTGISASYYLRIVDGFFNLSQAYVCIEGLWDETYGL